MSQSQPPRRDVEEEKLRRELADIRQGLESIRFSLRKVEPEPDQKDTREDDTLG